MNIKIPIQLQNSNFRFYRVKPNSKIPMDNKWPDVNNFFFFDSKLKSHLDYGGNYGVVCGYGNLIVLDFDCKDYLTKKKELLPKTFTVKTALKKMPHYYYILDGDMISKTAVDYNGIRRLDIQAARSAIIAPGSCIERAYYQIIDDSPIAHISPDLLKRLFSVDIKQFKTKKVYQGIGSQKDEVQRTIKLLKNLGIMQTRDNFFKCPFHEMSGNGNMFVGEEGHIHCFHCNRHFPTADDFLSYTWRFQTSNHNNSEELKKLLVVRGAKFDEVIKC